MKNILVLGLVTILLGSCSTLEGTHQAKGTGTKQIYTSSHDKTWDATVCSLKAQKLTIVKESKSENYILAQNGMTAFSFGENIAVFVREISKNKNEVEIVSKRKMQTNIFAPEWSNKVLAGIQTCLN